MTDRDELAEFFRASDAFDVTHPDEPLIWADAILAAGWRAPIPHCDHDWSTDRSTYGGNPWRECHLCGKQEDL